VAQPWRVPKPLPGVTCSLRTEGGYKLCRGEQVPAALYTLHSPVYKTTRLPGEQVPALYTLLFTKT